MDPKVLLFPFMYGFLTFLITFLPSSLYPSYLLDTYFTYLMTTQSLILVGFFFSGSAMPLPIYLGAKVAVGARGYINFSRCFKLLIYVMGKHIFEGFAFYKNLFKSLPSAE